jgi:hypothetical protein
LQAQEKAQENEITPKLLRWMVGKPWKQLQATLIFKMDIKTKNIKDTKSSKTLKKKKWGTYMNWFAFYLWHLIFASTKNHHNLTIIWGPFIKNQEMFMAHMMN